MLKISIESLKSFHKYWGDNKYFIKFYKILSKSYEPFYNKLIENEKILKKDNSQPFLRLYNYAQKYRQNYIEKYNDSNYNGIEQCVFTSERSNHIVNSKKALYVVVPRSV